MNACFDTPLVLIESEMLFLTDGEKHEQYRHTYPDDEHGFLTLNLLQEALHEVILGEVLQI